MKLSVIIIAKNAQGQIKEALESVNFADEKIVIDNGSSDKTKKICEEMGAKVYEEAANDFSKLRNAGLGYAKGEFVLYVDADERVTLELANSIRTVMESNSSLGAYRILRKNFYYGKVFWPHVEKLERFFRKDKLLNWVGSIHESPVYEGELGELSGFLLHYSHRDITSMLEKTIEWSKTEAELRLKAGHPKMTSWRFFRVMITGFYDSYVKQQGWKAGTVGIVESIFQAYSMFITYARLWEMQNEKQK